jgi:hypothetical protein
MKQTPKLIYKSKKQSENELIPAQYYGMPNGSVYRICYPYWDNEAQFEFQILKDFKYDYEDGILLGWRLMDKKSKKYEWWPMLDNSFIDLDHKVKQTQLLNISITTINKALTVLNDSIQEPKAVVKRPKSPKNKES